MSLVIGLHFETPLLNKYFVYGSIQPYGYMAIFYGSIQPEIELVIGQVSWIRQKDLHILTVGETSYTNNLKFFPTHPPGRSLSTSNIHNVILPLELSDI